DVPFGTAGSHFLPFASALSKRHFRLAKNPKDSPKPQATAWTIQQGTKLLIQQIDPLKSNATIR
ncbi:MAG: hypothetical protein ACKN9U_07115, partial [Pirellulaceae bacterium]